MMTCAWLPCIYTVIACYLSSDPYAERIIVAHCLSLWLLDDQDLLVQRGRQCAVQNVHAGVAHRSCPWQASSSMPQLIERQMDGIMRESNASFSFSPPRLHHSVVYPSSAPLLSAWLALASAAYCCQYTCMCTQLARTRHLRTQRLQIDRKLQRFNCRMQCILSCQYMYRYTLDFGFNYSRAHFVS